MIDRTSKILLAAVAVDLWGIARRLGPLHAMTDALTGAVFIIDVIGEPQPFAEARKLFPKEYETLIHADSRGQDALHRCYRNILRDTYEFSLSTIILEGIRLFGQRLCSIVSRGASYLNNAL